MHALPHSRQLEFAVMANPSVVVCEHMSRGMNDRHRMCVAEPGVCFLVRRVFDFMYDLDFILRL